MSNRDSPPSWRSLYEREGYELTSDNHNGLDIPPPTYEQALSMIQQTQRQEPTETETNLDLDVSENTESETDDDGVENHTLLDSYRTAFSGGATSSAATSLNTPRSTSSYPTTNDTETSLDTSRTSPEIGAARGSGDGYRSRHGERMSSERMQQIVQEMRRECSLNEEGAEELEMMNVDRDIGDDEEFSDIGQAEHRQEESGASADGIGVELVDLHGFHEASATDPDSHSSELGIRHPSNRSRDSVEYSCETFPILNPVISYVMKRLNRASNKKKMAIGIGVFIFLGLILFVSLFPASFVYVEYNEMGFSRNKVTGAHDYSQVYQAGCYLLAPQDEIVAFQATAHELNLKLSVMNSGGMSIGLQVMLQYFLRPEDLHILYKKYFLNYGDIIYSIAESTVKNTAIEFTMDQYRLNRSFVEAQIFQQLKRALSGDCCPSCCPSCASDKIKCGLSDCKTTDCSSGYHVDVRYFQLGRITIPDAVMKQYTKQVILKIEAEKEQYLQDTAIEKMSTLYEVQLEHNAALEIRKAAEAKRHVIEVTSQSAKDRDVQFAYIKALKKLYNHLNITSEEAKTSFMYLKALKDVSHNLYAFTYGFNKKTVVSP